MWQSTSVFSCVIIILSTFLNCGIIINTLVYLIWYPHHGCYCYNALAVTATIFFQVPVKFSNFLANKKLNTIWKSLISKNVCFKAPKFHHLIFRSSEYKCWSKNQVIEFRGHKCCLNVWSLLSGMSSIPGFW